MTISSRMPDDDPHRCSICGEEIENDASRPQGDSVCPRCGELLSIFRDDWCGHLGVDPKHIRLDTRLDKLGVDSLDTVEVVMQMEEDFDLHIPDEEARQISTLADLIRMIRRGEQERPDRS